MRHLVTSVPRRLRRGSCNLWRKPGSEVETRNQVRNGREVRRGRQKARRKGDAPLCLGVSMSRHFAVAQLLAIMALTITIQTDEIMRAAQVQQFENADCSMKRCQEKSLMEQDEWVRTAIRIYVQLLSRDDFWGLARAQLNRIIIAGKQSIHFPRGNLCQVSGKVFANECCRAARALFDSAVNLPTLIPNRSRALRGLIMIIC